jgi:hypothetical protein
MTGTTAAQKLEARRLQMLTKQRVRLEEEVKALEEEVVALVAFLHCPSFHILRNLQELKVLNK